MIFKLKKKPKLSREFWTKRFIWWPMFFTYCEDTFFVFMENVEVRQIVGSIGYPDHKAYRPYYSK